MKDKRAFTLVEVLGVLVIIGFIGAIAIPAVTSIVNKSKQKTAEEAAKAISRAARNYYEAQQLDYVEVKEVSLVDKTIEFEGKRPTKGAAYFDENGHMYVKMYYNGYCVVVDEQGETTSEKTSQQDCKVSGVVVSFETGDKNITIPSFEKEQGNVIGELPVLEREGYIFKGWYYKDINGNEQQASSNTIIEDSVIMTLYAKWDPLKYVVTLSGNGETLTEGNGWTISGSTATKTLSYGTMYGVLPSINKTGYKFLGWFTENGVKVESTSLVNIASNHTLTARLEKEKYIVTLKTEIGQIPQTGGWTLSSVTTTYDTATKTVGYEDPYGTLPVLTKEGYKFQGWYDANGNKIDSTTIINILRDHTLTAIWKENSYVVTFDAKGGSVSPETKEVSYNGTYGSLPTPVKTGYTFQGWYTLGGEQITSTSKVMISNNHTLNAVYNIKEYTVTLNANGGNISKDSITVAYNTAYGTLPTPTRTGYTFDGWYTAINGGTKVTSSTIYNLTDNQILYAKWRGNEYTVTFNATGGTSVSNKTVTTGNSYGTLPVTTKTGYTFLGWYTIDGTLIEENTIVSKISNHTLYAQWGENEYTLSYNANGGTVSPASTIIKYNSTYGTLPTPTRTGYTFLGWFTDINGGIQVSSSTEYTVDKNMTIYAHWTANKYDVTFVYGNGTSNTTSKVTYDSTYGTLPSPSKTGYTFNGWYTAQTGGTKVLNTTTVATAKNHTLYAQYTVNSYYVTLRTTIGSISSSSWTVSSTTTTNDTAKKKIAYGSTYSELPTLSKAGYTFNGWYTDSTNGTVVTSSTTMNSTSDHTLYARWTPNTYTVTFDTNITKYKNGDVVYFNPVTAKSCSASEAVSTTGTKTGCMKWYAFLDDGGSTVNLLLDHNTTATVAWNSDSDATTPDTVNAQLAADTTNWNATVKASARLISASEVNQMVPFVQFTYYNMNEEKVTATSWNENNFFTWHYFQTGNQTEYKGAAGSNTYAWLFNNTKNCTTYGCEVADSSTEGYWTSSQTNFWQFPGAWYVSNNGTFYVETVNYTTPGLRPVITINKSLLNNTKTITYTNTYGTLPTPTRTGYNFLGWYTTGGVKVDSSTQYLTASNQTLYAQWEVIKIKFYTSGEEQIAEYGMTWVEWIDSEYSGMYDVSGGQGYWEKAFSYNTNSNNVSHCIYSVGCMIVKKGEDWCTETDYVNKNELIIENYNYIRYMGGYCMGQ